MVTSKQMQRLRKSIVRQNVFLANVAALSKDISSRKTSVLMKCRFSLLGGAATLSIKAVSIMTVSVVTVGIMTVSITA
jgi:hypothetical protein